jgi:hypothetical protein
MATATATAAWLLLLLPFSPWGLVLVLFFYGCFCLFNSIYRLRLPLSFSLLPYLLS